ncbi:MAG: alpha/beta hydrolase [Chitinophagaceae bacterium]|nr:MAG: alpha/beta hydrolase [Chitinophagaceae bacterium]
MKQLGFFLLYLTTVNNFCMNAQQSKGQYAAINGLQLYFEIHGEGQPLVLLHGGGSTIESNFSRILPSLAKSYKVIAIESQSHGHTADIDRPTSFEQDADDVAALLDFLKIPSAHFMGFSNGGTTALQVAIRHPEKVNKLVLASTTYKRDGMIAGFFDGMKSASLENMPPALQDAYLKINPNRKGLLAMFNRDANRMINFKDIPDSLIKSIQAPALVINGDAEVVRVEHALEVSRTLKNAQLALLPGGHGDYIGEVCAPDKDSRLPDLVVEMIDEFLKK